MSVTELSGFHSHTVDIKDETADMEGGLKYEKIIKWFPSLEQANYAIHYFESSTHTKYNVLYKRFGRGRVSFNSDDGIPYITERIIKLECQYGKDRNKNYNAKRKIKKGTSTNKKYVRIQPSYKSGCCAFIDINVVTKYPQYKATSWRKNHRDAASCALREALDSGKHDVEKEAACRVAFPPPEVHRGHSIGQTPEIGIGRALDPRIISKIDELVEAGLISMKEIQKHLRKFVYEEIFYDQEAPSKSHKRFFPTKKVICDHYIKSCIKQNKVIVEGENLTFLIKDWESSVKTDNVFHQYAANITEMTSAAKPNKQIICNDDVAQTLSKSAQNNSEASVHDLIEAYNKFCPSEDAQIGFLDDNTQSPSQVTVERLFELLDRIKHVAHSVDNAGALQQAEGSLQQVLDGLLEFAIDSSLCILNSSSAKRKQSAETTSDHTQDAKRPTINITVVSNESTNMNDRTNVEFPDSTNLSPLLAGTDGELACVEVITDEPMDETVLSNGPYQITASSLITFKSTMLESRVKELNMDEIVNSYMWQLSLTHNILFVDSSVSKNIFQGDFDEEPWKIMSLSGKKYLFMPMKHLKNEWMMLVVDIERKTLLCFNTDGFEGNAGMLREAFSFLESFMRLRFDFRLLSVDASAHVDESSRCDGCHSSVQICMLAKALATSSFIADSAVVCHEEIYRTVAGSCLTSIPDNKSLCKLCREATSSGEGWIECARCSQWFHIKCVGLTFDEAESGVYFVCPEIG